MAWRSVGFGFLLYLGVVDMCVVGMFVGVASAEEHLGVVLWGSVGSGMWWRLLMHLDVVRLRAAAHGSAGAGGSHRGAPPTVCAHKPLSGAAGGGGAAEGRGGGAGRGGGGGGVGWGVGESGAETGWGAQPRPAFMQQRDGCAGDQGLCQFSKAAPQAAEEAEEAGAQS